MNLRISRIWPSPEATIGALYINGQSGFFTLEPGSAEGKGPIPAGVYQVVLLPSPHFEESADPWVQQYAKAMPHLVDVPNFTQIMFHWGDLPANTEGCILLGTVRVSQSDIGDSRTAFSLFYTQLQEAIQRGESVSVFVEDTLPMTVTDLELGM